MLREVGKRKAEVEQAFLQAHYKRMPRTMLRYTLEPFPEAERQQSLKGRVRGACAASDHCHHLTNSLCLAAVAADRYVLQSFRHVPR